MALVTTNAFERVLEIRTQNGAGTAFTINYRGAQYLVTARHLFPDGESSPQVSVSTRVGRRDLTLDLLRTDPPNADVAVARLDEPLTPDFDLPASFEGFGMSQELFFLGFPYGLATHVSKAKDRLAFMKRATLSAAAWVDGVHLLYLDGLNNPGFSGGPVVGQPASRSGEGLHVCGVIAGYRFENQPVYSGTELIGATQANTGIIVATQIQHVTEAIDRAS